MVCRHLRPGPTIWSRGCTWSGSSSAGISITIFESGIEMPFQSMYARCCLMNARFPDHTGIAAPLRQSFTVTSRRARNYTSEIHTLLTVELIHRLFIDSR